VIVGPGKDVAFDLTTRRTAGRINPNPANDYWEGLYRLLDGHLQRIGLGSMVFQ